MPNPANPLITPFFTLGGILVGGLITFATQTWLRFRERQQERQSLALAFAAEIEAYLEMVKRRGHVRRGEQARDAALAGQLVSLRGFISRHDGELESFPIAKANVCKIGLLGPLSGEVVAFYNWATAVRATLINANEGHYDGMSAADMARLIDEDLAIWRMADVEGRKLVNKLKGKRA
jgi:hypothetical protein